MTSDSGTVLFTVDLPNGGKVVVLNYDENRERCGNIICVGEDNDILWRAALPGNDRSDWFVSARLDGEAVVANTWNGFAVWLDPATGSHLRSIFVK